MAIKGNRADQPSAGDSCVAGPRAALIQAGLDLFGRFGLDGVSVRQVCDAAGMNVASVTYHFGGKDGLYDAIADDIVARVQSHMAPVIAPAMAFVHSGSTDRGAAIAHILAVHERIVELLVPDSSETERWARFIVRFQLGETTAGHSLNQNHVASVVRDLIGIARDRRDDQRGNTLLAFTFFGQILVFRVNRVSTRSMLNIDTFGATEIADIKRTVLANIELTLHKDHTS